VMKKVSFHRHTFSMPHRDFHVAFLLLKGDSKRWWPAVVTRIQQDGNILRQLKVFQIDGRVIVWWRVSLRFGHVHVGLPVETGQE
jgi:hypothetical protein